eukprot:GEMP01000309.1.p1 GENE.GEMP01000309.1~~GEMP01000309.1.p1  ORF type:complete len:944 (-),score=179.65 GEMP01000309.1:1831-4662(-)
MHSRNDPFSSSDSGGTKGAPRARGVPFVNVTEVLEGSERPSQSQNADGATTASPLRGKLNMPALPVTNRLHLRLHKSSATTSNAANSNAVDCGEYNEDRRGTMQFVGTTAVDGSDFGDACAELSGLRGFHDSLSTGSEDIRKLEMELDNLRFQLRMKDEEQKTEDFLSAREDSEVGSRYETRGSITDELTRLRQENAALMVAGTRVVHLESINAALASENTQLKHKEIERLWEIQSLKSTVRRQQKKSNTKLHLPSHGSAGCGSSGRHSNGSSARGVFNVEEDKITLRPLDHPMDAMSDPYSLSLASQGTSMLPHGRSSPTSSQLSASFSQNAESTATAKRTAASSAMRNVSFSVCSSDQQVSQHQNPAELSHSGSLNLLGTPRTIDDGTMRCLSDCPDANYCEVASLSLGSMRTSTVPQGMLSPSSSLVVFSSGAAHEDEMKVRGENASFSAIGSVDSGAVIGDMSLQSIQSSMRPGAMSIGSGGSMSQWAVESNVALYRAGNDGSSAKKTNLSECTISLPSVGSSLIPHAPTSPPLSVCSQKPTSVSSSMRANGIASPMSSVCLPDDISLSLASLGSSMICRGAPSMASSMCSGKPAPRLSPCIMVRPDSVRFADDQDTPRSARSFVLSLASKQSSLVPVLGDPEDHNMSCPLGGNSVVALSDDASSFGGSPVYRFHSSQYTVPNTSPKNGVDPRDTFTDFLTFPVEDAPLFGSTPAATITVTATSSLQAHAGSVYSPRSMTTPQIHFNSNTQYVMNDDENAPYPKGAFSDAHGYAEDSLISYTQSNVSPRSSRSSLHSFLRVSNAVEDMHAPACSAPCSTGDKAMFLNVDGQNEAREERNRIDDINAHALAVPNMGSKGSDAMTPSTDGQEEVEEKNDTPEAFFSDDEISMVSFPGSEQSEIQGRETVTAASSHGDAPKRSSTVFSRGDSPRRPSTVCST